MVRRGPCNRGQPGFAGRTYRINPEFVLHTRDTPNSLELSGLGNHLGLDGAFDCHVCEAGSGRTTN